MRHSLLMLCAGVGLGACAQPRVGERSLREIIGVTHAGGKYCLTQKDFLNEGGDQILEFGSQTIKLWYVHSEKEYPFHSTWPPCETMVDMAKTPYFRALFDKPFKTYILVAYSKGRSEHYWRDGVTDDQRKDEQRQFHDLARHFLTTYRGTGKTFILQHWEGDWAIRTAYDPEQVPPDKAFQGMADWLNARQSGVNQARTECGEDGVHVYHAAEVNLVVKAMVEGKPNVTNRVLPHTKLDLVSYSAWDTLADLVLFPKALDYIATYMPPSAAFGEKNVYVGEFGSPENEVSPEQYQAAIRNVTENALKWGCPYIVFWEIYCNEPRRTPVTRNEDCRGAWLIRPDGTRSWAWGYLRGKMGFRD
jgi:hypothetical protein